MSYLANDVARIKDESKKSDKDYKALNEENTAVREKTGELEAAYNTTKTEYEAL